MAMRQGELVPQIFEHSEFGEVRIVDNNGEPWFVATDICRILGLSNPTVALEKLDADERSKFNLGRQGETNVVNESGLYALTLTSRKPEAKRFRKWITAEVVPSIRKTGMYINPNAPINPAFLRRMADEIEQRDKQIATLTEENAKLKPKADYCELILQSAEALPVTVIAKDYGMGGAEFNKLLHKLKIQYKVGKTWVLCQIYAGLGYTKSVTRHFANEIIATTTYWTQKGRMFLYSALKKANVLPLIERNAPMATII